MRSLVVLGLVAVLLLSVVGCYSTPVMPPQSGVVMDIKAPLSADNQGVKLPVANEKVGRASCKQYVWVVTAGDSSIEAAAKAARHPAAAARHQVRGYSSHPKDNHNSAQWPSRAPGRQAQRATRHRCLATWRSLLSGRPTGTTIH